MPVMISEPAGKELRPDRAEEVARALRADILAARCPVGDFLPPQRVLAERFAVGRSTIREAVRMLEIEGLVRSEQGSGVRVLDAFEDGGMDLLGLLLAGRDEDRDPVPLPLVADLLELRRLLTGQVVELAKQRIQPIPLAELGACLAAQEAAARRQDLVRFLALDLDFSRQVVRAAGNLGLRLLFNTIVRILQRNMDVALALYPSPGDNLASSRAVYEYLAGRRTGPLAPELLALLEQLDEATMNVLRRRNETLAAQRAAAAET